MHFIVPSLLFLTVPEVRIEPMMRAIRAAIKTTMITSFLEKNSPLKYGLVWVKRII